MSTRHRLLEALPGSLGEPAGMTSGGSEAAGVATAVPMPGPASVRSLVLIWCGASVAALAFAQTDPRLALVAVLAGVLAALSVPGPSAIARVITVLALAPAIFSGSAPVSWVGAAALMAFVGLVGPGGLRAQPSQLSEPRRHLMRCRRRDEPAAVFVAALPGNRTEARRIAETFRLTDSVQVTRSGRRYEIHGVLDAGDFDRGGVERRVFHDAGGVLFGWASFPDDGVTLDVLVERARGKIPAAGEAAVDDPVASSPVATISTLARRDRPARTESSMVEAR